PCTRATLAELARLAARVGTSADIRVVVARVDGSAADVVRTPIPGAIVVADDDARERSLFGTYTSGDVLLYSSDGRLLFHGGITAARGHEGPSAGSERIADI